MKLFPTCILLVVATALAASPSRAASQPGGSNSDYLERAFAYDVPESGPRDAIRAVVLYRQAAAAGDAFAHLRLGYLAETGDGMMQDYIQARMHYQAAIDAGLAAARVRLAMCHFGGWGGPVDRAAFVRELTVAAEAEDVEAQLILARAYYHGIGIPQNQEAGLHWLERAAKQDDPSAQYLLGSHVEPSPQDKIRQSMSVARTWYSLSAEKEHQESMLAMARTFLHGPRSERDWALAQQWLLLSTELGDHEAPYILAVSEMIHPDSPKRDAVEARRLLELSESRGNDRAHEVMQQVRSGRALVPSIKYVMNEAREDRYVAQANVTAREQASKVAPGVRPPEVLRMREPNYPTALSLAKISGRVELELIVDTQGRVLNPKVLSSPRPEFSEAALKAVQFWEFRPGLKDGVPVNVRMRVPLDFDWNADERLLGLDDMLSSAAAFAKRLGTIPEEDYSELRLIQFAHLGPRLSLPPPESLPAGARAMILIVADAQGKPLRGYVLKANPEPLGQMWLDWLMQQTLKPRMVGGQPRAGNYVYSWRPTPPPE